MPAAGENPKLLVEETKAKSRRNSSMRALALLDQALDEIAKRRDPVAALVKAYDADPKAFIDWVMKHTEPKDEQAKGGNSFSFNGLFGLVAKQAEAQQLQALPPATDAEYTEVGVQSGYSTTQPIDTEW
jgi:hypothetical protein